MSFLKQKKFYALLIVGLVVIFVVYGRLKAPAVSIYDTVKVQRGDLVQTVDATGKIESSSDLQMNFEMSGTVGKILVKEGEEVKSGQILAELKADDLNAAVAQASANLQQRLAGATDEDKKYYTAAVVVAKAALDQASVDGRNTITQAEIALETAKNNLKMAEGGNSSALVDNAYDTAVAYIKTAGSALDSALTQADNILGVDNKLANDDFESSLSALDNSKIIQAKDQYSLTKEKIDLAKTKTLILNTDSGYSEIDEGLNATENALTYMNILLNLVADVLKVTPPSGNLTQTSLDAKKTTIESSRSSVSTNYSSIIAQKQNIFNAKNSYSTYKLAYDKAVGDLNAAKATVANNINIKQAAYDQAVANLDAKINPPREVDVAALRAMLYQAQANREKAIIRAPIDGIVAKINKKVGEQIMPSEKMVNLLTPHFEITVDIPETDVSKIKLNDQAVITLDAYGDDFKIFGKLVNIDYGATVIQDVVYYKIKVALDDTDKEIKSGMTANVVLNTDKRENVLSIPSRAIRTNGDKFVKVLQNNQAVDKKIKTGLRADDGKVEILEGLNEGEEIIISTK
ncbi:MAG TPA: efflux RND transporter periplasmic adaptor subunit [Candidatus Magasanikbacteria bacterium]|nr:efflux RND transporter periplasmic adaptor subunit [Candidatus Magasanikbacteria bacterium]